MNLKEIEPRNDIIVITDRTPSRNKIRSFYKWYANRHVSLVENIRNEMKTIKEEIAKEIDKIYPKLSENEFLAKVKTFEKIHEKCLIIIFR
jgi:hypothetical protein